MVIQPNLFCIYVNQVCISTANQKHLHWLNHSLPVKHLRSLIIATQCKGRRGSQVDICTQQLFTGFEVIIGSQRCLVIKCTSSGVLELVRIHLDRTMTPMSRNSNSRMVNKDRHFLHLSLVAHSPAVLRPPLDELGL